MVASVWANQTCTEKPVNGQTYSVFYVKLEKTFGFNESKNWINEGSLKLGLDGPLETDEGTVDAGITLYIDWDCSYQYPELLYEGTHIVKVPENAIVDTFDNWPTNFYSDGSCD